MAAARLRLALTSHPCWVGTGLLIASEWPDCVFFCFLCGGGGGHIYENDVGMMYVCLHYLRIRGNYMTVACELSRGNSK